MRIHTPAILIGLVLSGLASSAAADGGLRSAAPDGAEAYFISPRDGDVVPATFVVRFGLKGMGIAPAGVDQPGTGHHHLLIDLAEDVTVDQPLPTTEQVRHFGGGQTETEVTLPPGKHTLQLLLGNHLHVPHDPPVRSPMISITVDGEAR